MDIARLQQKYFLLSKAQPAITYPISRVHILTYAGFGYLVIWKSVYLEGLSIGPVDGPDLEYLYKKKGNLKDL